MATRKTTPMAKTESLDSRLAYAVFALIFGGLAFGVGIYAIDTANLYSYALAFVAFGFAVRDAYRAIRGVKKS